MKIALFTESYLPHINGVVTHVKTLKDGLQKLGHEVLIVTADANAKRHYIRDGVLHCPATRIKKFYNYGIAKPLSFTRLKFIRKFNPDIIHVHTEFGIGLSGVQMAKELKKPLIYTLHTMYDDYIYYIAPKLFTPAAKKLSHVYAKYFAKNAQAITGPSEKCSEYLKNIGSTKEVVVIPNAVELDAFDPSSISDERKEKMKKKVNVPDDIFVICFVGRLGKEKSVDLLIEYWAKSMKDQESCFLVIMGEGPAKQGLIDQAKELGVSGSIKFTGSIAHNKLPDYFTFCDAYITASLSDTNSISMLEGMAMELPVIARNDPMNENQVLEGVNGFIFDNENEMRDKILKVKNMSEDELKALKISTRNEAMKSSSEALARNLLKVYEQFVDKQYHTQMLDKTDLEELKKAEQDFIFDSKKK